MGEERAPSVWGCKVGVARICWRKSGEAPTPKDDVYALGVLAYQLFMGHSAGTLGQQAYAYVCYLRLIWWRPH